MKLLIKKFLILMFVFSLPCFSLPCAHAASTMVCQTSKPKSKPYGVVSRTECHAEDGSARDTINLNGKAVLSDVRLFPEDSNKDGSIRVYASGTASPITGCAPKLYLLDMSNASAKVLAFGVKGACNEFHWASWGYKRSVIALKRNVSFIYENGKLTPPAAGEELFNSIEPPHAGPGLTEELARGFVENVPLPTVKSQAD